MLNGQVFSEQIFESKIFAIFINTFLNGKNGIVQNYRNGMAVSYSGNNVSVSSGAVCIQGRFLEEDSSSTLTAGTDSMYCKLVIEIDLDKTNTESDFQQGYYKIVTSSTGYPTLTQTNVAENNAGVYQYELARFKTSANGISEFQDMRTYIGDELQYQLIDNLNSIKAPNNHASSNTTYGLGTQSNYGHNKLVNNLTTTSYQDGLALSAYQGKLLNDKVTTAQSTADTARSEAQSANSNANGRLSTSGGSISGDLTLWGEVSLRNDMIAWGDIQLMSGKSIYVGTGTNSITLSSNGNVEASIVTANNQITNFGDLYNDGAIRSTSTYDYNTVTNTANMYITSNGWIRRTTNTSSQRYKKDIKDLKDEALNPEKLYDLKVKQFKYKKEYQPNEKDSRYNKNLVGFIAEDLAEIYPIAADFNEEGQVENWNERYLIPAMLDLIQKQNERIKALEEKVGVE